MLLVEVNGNVVNVGDQSADLQDNVAPDATSSAENSIGNAIRAWRTSIFTVTSLWIGHGM